MNLRTIYFFGFTLLRLILKRIFLRENQEELLRWEFKNEGIFTINEKLRNIYPGFSRCINCGFCEVDIPLHSSIYAHPEFLFNAMTTNLTDLIGAQSEINSENQKFHEIKNFRCPAGAIYKELITFITSAR